MADPVEYKLITYVDPRKVNFPIREKFAKLTLSNKKKKEEKDELNDDIIAAELNRESSRRASASCNLLMLLDDNDTECPNNQVNMSKPAHINPLLISESSHSDETQLNASQMQKVCDGLVDTAFNTELSDHLMQPLHSSDDVSPFLGDDIDREVEMLSQKVSTLSVDAQKTKTHVTSSEVHEATLLVSTESQRMSCDLKVQQVRKSTARVGRRNKQDDNLITTIAVLSSSGTESECGSAITVSDTSESEAEFMDFDVMTSDIPASGDTTDALLPNTFSNTKADRMEAFLRDVSQQRREMKENDATLLTENSTLTDQNKKTKDLAYADTESMTSFGTEQAERPQEMEESVLTEDENITNGAVAIAQLDTISMTRSYTSAYAANTGLSVVQDTLSRVNQNSNDSRRLAYDETEDYTPNTVLNSSNSASPIKQYDSFVCSEHGSLVNTSGQDVIPEESVVISETSSETVNSSLDDSKCNKEVVSSEPSPLSYATSSSLTQSQFQMDVGSINISAKINIKISISQQISGSEGTTASDSSSSKGDSPNDEKRIPSLLTSEENVECTSRYVEQRRQNQQNDELTSGQADNAIERNNGAEDTDEGEDVQFLTQAERLLNQIYGHSWKTPDVIRTLKRTSRNDGTSKSPTLAQDSTPTKAKTPTPVKTQASPAKCTRNAKKELVDQSVLDDFSIFRRNIVETNLNSTRLATPKSNPKQTKTERRVDFTNIRSEPRLSKKDADKQKENVFKIPQTEGKKRRARNVVTTTSPATPAQHWRKIVNDNSDTSGDNASDDESVNETKNEISCDGNSSVDDKGSDHSWRQSSSDDSDYEIPRPNKTKGAGTRRQLNGRANAKNKLIYLDLSKDEVSVQEGAPDTPPANDDVNFNTRLEDVLRTCSAVDKSKLPATPTTSGKPKRKLFTANFGEEDVDLTIGDDGVAVTPKTNKAFDDDGVLYESEHTPINGGLPKGFEIFNKHLEAIKRGIPIFKTPPPQITKTPRSDTPSKSKVAKGKEKGDNIGHPLDKIWSTPNYKYGFLKSLDVRVAKSLCHPDALCYRDNYRLKKEELAKILYDLYNEKVFNNTLNVPLVWNKKLCNTAGRCLNKKKLGTRSSVVELSEKVLTSADRLRCTLIHELCHAATWIFNGEGGHGNIWKQWAQKANNVFPEIPKIGVCHQYDIEYKYTYKCTLCAAKSHAHSKSKKVENIRCAFCHGNIEIYLNKKDKDGNIIPTPVKEPTGFAKFVKDNYKQYKRPDLKHADVMKILSNEFASLKVAGSAK